jgi:hypothetical protein
MLVPDHGHISRVRHDVGHGRGTLEQNDVGVGMMGQLRWTCTDEVRPRLAHTVRAVMVVGMILAARMPGSAAEIASPTLAEAQAMEQDCLDQLMAPSGDIACGFPTIMDDAMRATIGKLTQDEFKDARCMITVKLDRSIVDAVTAAADGKVSVPPQTVACELDTKTGKLPVDFSFAPTVTFKGGVAIGAHAGMGQVKGVNTWLAWPVVTFINGNSDLRSVMLRVVNAYVARRRQ